MRIRAKQPPPHRPPEGRYARVWLSPEFLAESARHFLLPEMFAACVLHSRGLRPGAVVRIISHGEPIDPAQTYDLPALARAQTKAADQPLRQPRKEAP